MKPGRRMSVRPWCAAACCVLLLSGCFSTGKRQPLSPTPPDKPIIATEVYTLACPDAIEVIFTEHPERGRFARIGPDGCVHLGPLGAIRVEGDTPAEAAARIAERAERSPRQVLVQVAEFNSRQIFLFGEVRGEPRIVDYRGPETVLELLRRCGGLSPDAAPNQVFVVRAQLGEGIPAEVLTVDLDAIQRKDNHRTNVRIQPLDEVYVGETTRSRVSKALPGFMRPIYESLVGIIPTRETKPESETTKPK